MVKFENIEIKYGDFVAIENLNLDIKEGEFFTFLGPSGCGKTTSLRALVGFLSPSKGKVYVGDKDVTNLPVEKRNIGMVFQSYALFPTMSVYDNIAFGMKVKKASKTEIDQKVHEVAAKIKITESQLKKNVSDLSGGQQQRVALARAIVLEPKILCLDEPLSNLDAKLRIDMRMELKRLQKELGITTLYVTHDQEEALTLSDRIAVFNNGYVEQVGTPYEIYNESKSEFVCDFIGDINRLKGELLSEVNVLVKAFGYDSSDQIYKFFMLSGVILLGMKLVTTRYTLREIVVIALMLGAGLFIWVMTKKATILFLFLTIIGIKDVCFRKLIEISVWTRLFVAFIMVAGSAYGLFDIGYKTVPNAQYVEVPVYSLGFSEPNAAYMTIFLLLMLMLYYFYEKLNIWWFFGTCLTAFIFYKITFCRTGIIVFFFAWGIILFEKLVKNKKVKFIYALSIPVGAIFSFVMMILFNSDNDIMKTIDRYVSGRVYILGKYYHDQGLALLPRNQEYFYASYHGLIDNAYMYILLYCGWIFAIAFFAALCVMLVRLYKAGGYKELVMLSVFALYGIMEQFVLNGFMNPFILLAGVLLYPTMLNEISDGGDNGKISNSSNS